MRAGVYCNKKHADDNAGYVREISDKLRARGHECVRVWDFCDLDGVDVLFVLGGDGTILSVAAQCAVRGIKIIGINYGHVGFLAEFEREKIDDAVKLVCGGKYQICHRSMLKISYGDNTFYALNDLVIQRNTAGSDFANTVNLHAEIDGVTLDNFSSDGLIISTPTGSTAYSLAAGGSVLSPELNALIITPICAHTLHSRPVVIGDSSVIAVNSVNVGASLVMAVDGSVKDPLKAGEIVTVSKADCCADFITTDDKNFFSKLLLKLSIWSK